MRFILLLLSLLVSASAMAAQQSETQCRNLYRLTDLAYAVEPGRVFPASDSLPSHCKVRAVINRAIQVEVTMPVSNWNGRMMFSTVGGGAGSIGDITSLLSRGFAMASTDTGHEGLGLDFGLQPEALLDYGYRGVHLATQFAKDTIERYYDEKIHHSYLKGCSNGGRAALLEATRFPDDYDGIIAGAPVFRFGEFLPWAIEAARKQAENPLTQKSLELLDANSRSSCDQIDGVADGVINDPRLCTLERLNLSQLSCENQATDDCLTSGQIKTAEYLYGGLIDSDGKLISPPVMPGAESAGDWAMWMFPNSMLGEGSESLNSTMSSFLAIMMRRLAAFNIDEFDPSVDYQQLEEISFMDVSTADLGEFKNRGGKILIYQGWNDFPLRPGRAIDYLAEVERVNGGAKKADDFFRMFMVPGMVHCATGPGAWMADYVDPIVEWTEEGVAPERITAVTAPAPQSFSRPLCVYPKLAHYKGRGDKDKASSYRCSIE